MSRHLILFSPDGHPVSRATRLRAAVHNWLSLVIVVNDSFIKRGGVVPRRYRRSHILQYEDAWVWAVPPLHWVLRGWFAIGGVWCLHRAAHRLGLLELDDTFLYSAGKLRWPWCTKWAADRSRAAGERLGRMSGRSDGFAEGRHIGYHMGRAAALREVLRRRMDTIIEEEEQAHDEG